MDEVDEVTPPVIPGSELPVIDVGPLITEADRPRHRSPSPVPGRGAEDRGRTAPEADQTTAGAEVAAVDAAVAEVAAAIDRACRQDGFFLVTGHGVGLDLLAELDAAARRFFALPEATKAEVAMSRGGRAWRGWFPEGGELTSGRPDHKEGYYFGAELAPDDSRVVAGLPLHGPNLFPTSPSALRGLVLRWIEEMTTLGHALALGIGLGLGLDGDWFHRHLTADPTVLFRIFRYPARPPDGDGWGVAEHTDYGLLTILAHDGSSGLQIRRSGEGAAADGAGDRVDEADRSGDDPSEWVDVPVVPGAFVVNIGDMLDRMTEGRYRSTPHRVLHTGSADGRDRLSFPFFFDPGWEAEVLPVPLDSPAPDDDAPTRWDRASVHEWSGTYGDYLTAKVSKVFPALGAHHLHP